MTKETQEFLSELQTLLRKHNASCHWSSDLAEVHDAALSVDIGNTQVALYPSEVLHGQNVLSDVKEPS